MIHIGHRAIIAVVFAAILTVEGCGSAPHPPAPHPSAAHASVVYSPAPRIAPQLHASGNKLANVGGQLVVLHGVDRSGTEDDCVQGRGIFNGPTDEASVSAMKSWGVNSVRLPLNEACWNGEPYVNPAYASRKLSGRNRGVRQTAQCQWHRGDLRPALERWPVHREFLGFVFVNRKAVCQKPRSDLAGSVPFWSSVASIFKGNNAVIFDLFNEPYPDRALSTEAAAWQCWRNGGAYCQAWGIPLPVWLECRLWSTLSGRLAPLT